MVVMLNEISPTREDITKFYAISLSELRGKILAEFGVEILDRVLLGFSPWWRAKKYYLKLTDTETGETAVYDTNLLEVRSYVNPNVLREEVQRTR